jgi:LPS O-antigen subunit length determinant protein (WzzB/FepE family)
MEPLMEPIGARENRIATAFEPPAQFSAHRETAEEFVDLREYLAALARRWRLLAAATIGAMAAAGLFARFAMTRYYRAEAIIRPINASMVQGRLSGLLGGVGGFGGLTGASLSPFAGEAANPASEYMPVLRSFDFTTRLIARHSLAPELPIRGWAPWAEPTADPQWARYRLMKRRFDCEFSLRTGNLTLSYMDPDPAMARRILAFYISDLRERLRREQIRDAAEAIDSLRGEVRETADNLLQTQLSELLARQIQQEKLAQVQANFAFKVLVEPTASDRPYRPLVMLDALLAGAVTLFVLAVAILLREADGSAARERTRGGAHAKRI